jgi:hypothetical protein
MKQATDPAATGSLSVFEQACRYCGARFRVLAAQPADETHVEAYACPECGKTYEVEAAAEPEVQLLKPRSDGKDDRYQETMF